nr:PREDICTED: uncharacterized protein LOC100876205 [Megachile rotundata]
MNTSKNKDLIYAMKPFKILSWPLGTWPLQTYNLFALTRFVFAISVMLVVQVILNSEMCLNPTDVEANLDALMFSVVGTLALSKVLSFRFYSTKLIFNFVSAVKDYNELDEENKRMIMRRHAYMSRVMCVALIGIGNVCAWILTALPILLKGDQEINVTVEDTITFPLPSKTVILLLNLPENLYLLIFFVQYLMMVIMVTGNLGNDLNSRVAKEITVKKVILRLTSSDLVFFGIVFHLCGQAEILKMQFTRLINDSGETTENFPSLIKRHDYLLQLSKMLNDVISFVLVIQLLASCVLISTCGFQFILALNTRNIIIVLKTLFILLTVLIQLYSYSYMGDYLKSQMDGIGYSLYSCSWYSLPANVAKNIVLVILRAQIPVHLTAGKFFVVNLETFMSILKTSMSYLSILRVMITT